MTESPKTPVRIFICFARKDLEHLEALETHLANLKRQGVIEVWTDQKLLASTQWEPELLRQLREAQLVLVLMSPDMMASDFIHDIELAETLERHRRGEVRVVPVLVRPTDFKGHALDRFQGLPRNFKPVVQWQDRDAAWLDVVEGLRAVMEGLRHPSQRFSATPTLAPTQAPAPVHAPDWDAWVKLTLERNRYLELAGIRRPSSGGSTARNTMGFELEQVYVELRAENVHHPGLRHTSQGLGFARDNTLGLHEALQHSRRLLILGDPGCGKTTLLRYMARKLALGWLAEHHLNFLATDAREVQTLLKWPSNKPLPVPVMLALATLSSFLEEQKLDVRTVREQHVRDFLLQQLGGANCPLTGEMLHQALENEGLFLLLDGLDEVPDQTDRVRVCTAVRCLLERFRSVPLILTSRTRAFQGGVTDALTTLPRYVVQPMSRKEVSRFLQLWFEAAALSDLEQVRQDAEKGQQKRVAGEQGREKAKKLHQELEAHGELSKLALNPNILTLVALIRRSSPNAKLPERRVDLYKEVIPLFLHRRDEDRDVSVPWKTLGLDLDDFEKLSLVACLALAMHEHGAKGKGRRQSTGARTVPEDMAVRHLREQLVLTGKVTDSQGLSKAKKLLHWLEERPGLLRLTDEGVEFTHLGYQEYLVAVALKERHHTDKGLLAEVLPRLMDDWWNEPLRLLLTLLDERAERLLTALVNVETTGGKTDWQRRGRGLALAMGALQEIPADRIPQARPEVLKHMDGLLGRETRVPVTDRVETLLALGQVGDPRLGLEKPENWIWIPPGEFYMGSEDGAEYEKPVHQVTLTQEFHLSRFPVTNHDFKAFMDDNGYRTQAWWSEEGWAFCHKEKLDAPRFWANARWNAPNQPVVGVSWYEAEAFCHWMTQQWSSQEGRRVARLPSEAEWEYAARGKEGRRYPWGKDKPTAERANYDQTRIGQTSPVGAFPLGATPEGVHDMAGNVWEWCGDWYGKYPSDTHINPLACITGSCRLLRGGYWLDDASYLRGANRLGRGPSDRYDSVGFRVVWSASRGAAL